MKKYELTDNVVVSSNVDIDGDSVIDGTVSIR